RGAAAMPDRPRRTAAQSHSGSRRDHPCRAGGGRGSQVGCDTLSQDGQWCLPCNAGDARQAVMMQVLSVAAEAYPLVKTGGLGYVDGALPGALASHGVTVTTLVPGYPAIRKYIGDAPLVHHYGNLMGAEARILASHLNGHPLLVLDAPALFLRDGGIYGDR